VYVFDFGRQRGKVIGQYGLFKGGEGGGGSVVFSEG